ncbi:MAG: hypothetical protein ACI8SE_000492, partial [Bacteroidia bacterium]
LKIKNKAVQRAALLLSILVVSLASCKKATEEIAVDFIPKGNIHGSFVSDSFDIKAYTIREDSLKIDSLRSNILGAINDASFGKSSASLYTQILLREINVNFGTNPVIDSVVLSLAKDMGVPSYGHANSSLDLDIFRMDELIEKEKKYYSNYIPAVGDKIGSWTGTINATDTAWFIEDGNLKYQTNVLRIPLDNSFGEDFFTNGQFGSNEVFLNYLNGIALIPNVSTLATDAGAIIGIDKSSDESKLVVYYNGGLRKEFEINSESQNISMYQITDQNIDIQNQFNNPGTHFNETYVQSMAGCKTRIEISDLLKLVQDGEGIVINEAKLTFSVQDNSTSDAYEAPSRMLLLQPSETDGSNAFVIDLIDVLFPPSQSWVGYTNYGGGYNADDNTYSFGITRHLQLLLDSYLNSGEDNNRGFYLIIPSDNPMTPSRVILNTDTNSSNKNIQLKVTYTKL